VPGTVRQVLLLKNLILPKRNGCWDHILTFTGSLSAAASSIQREPIKDGNWRGCVQLHRHIVNTYLGAFNSMDDLEAVVYQYIEFYHDRCIQKKLTCLSRVHRKKITQELPMTFVGLSTN